jgi:predicted hydrocarbon binding protein
MSDDWIKELLSSFQDQITKGTYEAIYSLDGEARDHIMRSQATACVHAFVDLFAIPKELDLDGFLEHMKYGGSSKVDIRRENDTIEFIERHEGECMCPLVKRDAARLTPQLCDCAVHWLRMLVQRHTDKPVAVELVESVATGARDCTFRIRLGTRMLPE